MAKKPKKNNRRKANRADAKVAAYDRRRRLLASFPRFVVDVTNAPPALADAVQDIVRQIVLDQEHVFPPNALEAFRFARANGFVPRPTNAFAAARAVRNLERLQRCISDGANKMQEEIFRRLPRALIQAHLPMTAFRVRFGCPRHNEILVDFDSLLARRSAIKAKVWHSRTQEAAIFQSRACIPAFSKHCIEQITHRVVGSDTYYIDYYLAFQLLNNPPIRESCQLPDGTPALRLFGWCVNRQPFRGIAEACLGDDFRTTHQYAYLIGYCPVILEGNLAIAKTLLAPGMNKTPERALLDLRRVDLNTYKRLLPKVDEQSIVKLIRAPDHELVAFFHQQGIHQVRILKGAGPEQTFAG